MTSVGMYIEPVEHYALLRYILETYRPTGCALEFGVGKGLSTGIIAKHMSAVGYDSGLGLPERWRPEFPAGSFSYDIPCIPGVEMVAGWYEDTLPGRVFPDDIGLVHIDCDLYSSTKTVLDNLGAYLKPGVYVVFDEYHSYEGCAEHEQRAWHEFVSQYHVRYDVVADSFEQICFQITGIGYGSD